MKLGTLATFVDQPFFLRSEVSFLRLQTIRSISALHLWTSQVSIFGHAIVMFSFQDVLHSSPFPFHSLAEHAA